MAKQRTLTATDAIVAVSVKDYINVPFVVDEFELDNAWQLDDVTVSQNVLTLDGKLIGGYVNSKVGFTFNIMPTSNAYEIFAGLMQKTINEQRTFEAIFNVTLRGMKANYVLTEAQSVSGKFLPNVNSIVQPVSFRFEVSSRNIAYTSAAII